MSCGGAVYRLVVSLPALLKSLTLLRSTAMLPLAWRGAGSRHEPSAPCRRQAGQPSSIRIYWGTGGWNRGWRIRRPARVCSVLSVVTSLPTHVVAGIAEAAGDHVLRDLADDRVVDVEAQHIPA